MSTGKRTPREDARRKARMRRDRQIKTLNAYTEKRFTQINREFHEAMIAAAEIGLPA